MFSKIWKRGSGKSDDDGQKQSDLEASNKHFQAAEPLEQIPFAEEFDNEESRKMFEEPLAQLNSMISVLHQAGAYEDAIRIATMTSEQTRAAYGDQHPNFAKSLKVLADLYISKGDPAAAEPVLKQAMKIGGGA